MNEEKYLTVTALTRYIYYKFSLDENLKTILLEAEISNFKRHSSNNLYLTLKDEGAQISAMMFQRDVMKLDFSPKEGDKVYVRGYISLYEKGGYYQFIIQEMKPSGVGNLYLELEKLKKELGALGYFSLEHKKSLPRFPRTIAVITSPTGAVIRDICNTIRRRYPFVEIVLYPTLVQGSEAKISIARQLQKANADNLADVIILARGGGSIEDLWPFNERIVADAIFNSLIPVISAVGHETDYTIADFVADVRAATPTAAAEIATPNREDLIRQVRVSQDRIKYNIQNIFNLRKQALANLERILNQNNPEAKLKQKRELLDLYTSTLQKNILNQLHFKRQDYLNLQNKLAYLSPYLIFDKGYSMAEVNGKVVRNVTEVMIGETLKTRLKDGMIISEIKEVSSGKN